MNFIMCLIVKFWGHIDYQCSERLRTNLPEIKEGFNKFEQRKCIPLTLVHDFFFSFSFRLDPHDREKMFGFVHNEYDK